MRLVTVAAFLMLVGCAETAVIRVMDYGGALPSVTGRGCAVHQSGKEHAFSRILVIYEGNNCTVEVLSDVPVTP
jgi:hypothetical protein